MVDLQIPLPKLGRVLFLAVSRTKTYLIPKGASDFIVRHNNWGIVRVMRRLLSFPLLAC